MGIRASQMLDQLHQGSTFHDAQGSFSVMFLVEDLLQEVALFAELLSVTRPHNSKQTVLLEGTLFALCIVLLLGI